MPCSDSVAMSSRLFGDSVATSSRLFWQKALHEIVAKGTKSSSLAALVVPERHKGRTAETAAARLVLFDGEGRQDSPGSSTLEVFSSARNLASCCAGVDFAACCTGVDFRRGMLYVYTGLTSSLMRRKSQG